MTTTDARSLQRVLIARAGRVHVADVPTGGPPRLAGLDLLEAEAMDRGYALAIDLRAALGALDTADLAAAGSTLLSDLDALVGAGHSHQPMFRRFPHDIPADTELLRHVRVLVHYLQEPAQPCVLCGATSDVFPVNPCAHLVCSSCFPPAEHAACPICNRSLDPADPYITAGAAADLVARHPSTARPGTPARLRVLSRATDLEAAVSAELGVLLGRATALSGTDREHLHTLLDTRDRQDLAWLPADLPGRETKALVLAWLTATGDAEATAAACRLMDTATDVARLLVVRSGGDPSMLDPPRLTSVPRPLRRALLRVLEELCASGKAGLVADDMARRPTLFTRIGERLHPFEHAGTFPAAAAMFAVVRGTRLTGDALATRVLAAAGSLQVVGDRLRHRSVSGAVESMLAHGEPVAAADLLGSQRPGELVRRLDHLLRSAVSADDGSSTPAVLRALASAVHAVAPAVIVSAIGALRTRPHVAEERHPRVFFTANGRTHIGAETRPVLPDEVVGEAIDVLAGEILARAESLPTVDIALVDRSLDTVIAPFGERTASRALSTLARGTQVALPEGRSVRLFVHWTESDVRVDLDLSVAMYDPAWSHVDTCDYTRLRPTSGVAVHSGDYTSAPAPHGASEFIDLDLDALAAAGVAHVVATVLSYNDVAFDDMAEAFAGLMALPRGYDGKAFDARGVEQRFDLAGRHRAHLTLVVDVAHRSWRWADLAVGVTGTDHAIWNTSDRLAVVAAALGDVFDRGSRLSIGELAVVHAAARATTVLVRDADGTVRTYVRGVDEEVASFAARLGTGGAVVDPADVPPADLAFVATGDIDVAPGAEAFALHPRALDGSEVRLLAAADVLSALTAR